MSSSLVEYMAMITLKDQPSLLKSKSVTGGAKMAAKKPSKITYATIMVCVFTLAFFGVCTPQFTQVDLTGIVAEVNGEEISYHEFVRAYKRMSDSMRSRYGEDYDPASLQIASQTVDQLVKERIMSQQAQALGIRASDEEVVKYLARLAAFTDEKGQFSPEYMNSYLRANNYTEATFQEELRRSLSVSRLRDLLLYSTFASESRIEDEYLITENKLNVSYLKIPTSGKNSLVSSEEISRYVNDATQEEKLKSWYDSHTSDYQTEEEVKARHILISFEGARSASTAAAKRSKQEARSLAEKVLSMVTAEDADFNQIAKQNTDEPQGKDSGGDLGYFTREAMVKPFADVAFSLNKGQISDIVETDFGFHIIKKEDIKPAKNISYEDAKQDIAKKMLQKEKGPKEAQKQADAILAQLKSGQDTSETVKQYGLAWKNTGDFT